MTSRERIQLESERSEKLTATLETSSTSTSFHKEPHGIPSFFFCFVSFPTGLRYLDHNNVSDHGDEEGGVLLGCSGQHTYRLAIQCSCTFNVTSCIRSINHLVIPKQICIPLAHIPGAYPDRVQRDLPLLGHAPVDRGENCCPRRPACCVRRFVYPSRLTSHWSEPCTCLDWSSERFITKDSVHRCIESW